MRRLRLIFIILCMFSLVRGQTSLSISPLQAELKISPGKNKKTSILIGNDSYNPVRINVKVESWYLDGKGNPIFNGSQSVPFSCRDWIEVESKPVEIGPRQNKEVSFKVTVPKGTSPGHYWAAVSFVPQVEDESEHQGDGMLIQQRIISGIFVKVGKFKSAGTILDILPSPEDQQSELVINYENSGRSYFFSSGQIEIKNPAGKKILKAELPGELVLPQSQREVRVSLDERLAPGRYSITCSLEIPSMKKVEFNKELDIE